MINKNSDLLKENNDFVNKKHDDFKDVQDDTKLDLIHLDNYILEIRSIIQDFENQCILFQLEADKEIDVVKKNNWFKIKNQIREKSAIYFKLYAELLESKRRYRENQQDLLHKKLKYYNIDLSKITNTESEGMSVSGLVSLMNNIQNMVKKAEDNPIIYNSMPELHDLKVLEEDKYKL